VIHLIAFQLLDSRWQPSHLPSDVQAVFVVDSKYHRCLAYVPPTMAQQRTELTATMAAWMVQARDSGFDPSTTTSPTKATGPQPGATVVDGLVRHKVRRQRCAVCLCVFEPCSNQVTECSSLTTDHQCYAFKHTRFYLYVLMPAKVTSKLFRQPIPVPTVIGAGRRVCSSADCAASCNVPRKRWLLKFK
jgi:hypothetical protein